MQSAWVVVTEALGPCEYEDQGETTGLFLAAQLKGRRCH